MIQIGDLIGIGMGGESIWGGEFEDEFYLILRYDRSYIFSMVNVGLNINGFQFFIIVVLTVSIIYYLLIKVNSLLFDNVSFIVYLYYLVFVLLYLFRWKMKRIQR